MTDLSGTSTGQFGVLVLICLLLVIGWCVLDYLADRKQGKTRTKAIGARPANRKERS